MDAEPIADRLDLIAVGIRVYKLRFDGTYCECVCVEKDYEHPERGVRLQWRRGREQHDAWVRRSVINGQSYCLSAELPEAAQVVSALRKSEPAERPDVEENEQEEQGGESLPDSEVT